MDAKAVGARIVATGRSDFANRVNNSLGFPGIFRGVLDVRARTITDEMAIAAAGSLADLAREQGLVDERILPGMGEMEVAARVAAATGAKAQAEGVALRQVHPDQLYQDALVAIRNARDATRVLVDSEIIPPTVNAADVPIHALSPRWLGFGRGAARDPTNVVEEGQASA